MPHSTGTALKEVWARMTYRKPGEKALEFSSLQQKEAGWYSGSFPAPTCQRLIQLEYASRSCFFIGCLALYPRSRGTVELRQKKIKAGWKATVKSSEAPGRSPTLPGLPSVLDTQHPHRSHSSRSQLLWPSLLSGFQNLYSSTEKWKVPGLT